MRIEELTVEVRDGSLERVGQILPADLVGFKASLRFNNVGSWEIELPANHAMADALRQPSAGIVVTGLAGVLFSGPTTAATNSKTDNNPQGTWKIQGVTDSVVLSERLAYPTPSSADVASQSQSNDIRTGIASTVILGYVNDNIGPNAPVEREIPGLAIMTDPLIGSTVYGSARFDVLGELISGLASVDQLGFDIRQSDGSLEFYVYQPVDRSGYIRMDVLNNTLSRAEYAYGNHSLSRAIVAGQGQGVDRQFLEITSTESLSAESLWGRRIETFIDQRNTTDINELTQAGVEALADGGATLTSIDVVPSNDLTMRFGIDWGLGDRVSVEVGDQEVQAIVTNVAISVEADGVRVGATVGEPTGVDYEALIAKKQVSSAKRINALERKEGGGTSAATLEQEVKNDQGATISKGQAVYVSGANGTNVLVKLAQANTESTSSKTLGLMSETLAVNGIGKVHTEGFLGGVNTSAAVAGDPVWLSPTTAGGLIFGLANKPQAPNHLVYIGVVLRAHAVNGEIYVKVQNGFELDELHDVKITSPAANQVIVRDPTNSFWQNGEGSSGITMSDTAPTNPKDKDLWLRTVDGTLFIRWNDGNTSQWVEIKNPNNYTGDTQFDAVNARLTAVETTLVPAGSITQFAGASAPTGYLLCQGQAISRTTYAGLFAAIGTQYGTGNGSTTFNIPNLQGKVPVGKASSGTFASLNGQGGAETVSLTSSQMPSHRHWISAATVDDRNWTGSGGNTQDLGIVSDAGSYSDTDQNRAAGRYSHWQGGTSNGSNGAAHENMPPYIVTNYIIKT